MKRFENFYFIDKFSCCCTFVCQKPVFLTIFLSFYYFTAIVCNILYWRQRIRTSGLLGTGNSKGNSEM